MQTNNMNITQEGEEQAKIKEYNIESEYSFEFLKFLKALPKQKPHPILYLNEEGLKIWNNIIKNKTK